MWKAYKISLSMVLVDCLKYLEIAKMQIYRLLIPFQSELTVETY